MPLEISVAQKGGGTFTVSPVGSIDANTYAALEGKLDSLLAGTPEMIVLDMHGVHYISSMGIRVILKMVKTMKSRKRTFAIMNLQPQIKKVFDIINALPSMKVFESMAELDGYLDLMQRRVREEEGSREESTPDEAP